MITLTNTQSWLLRWIAQDEDTDSDDCDDTAVRALEAAGFVEFRSLRGRKGLMLVKLTDQGRRYLEEYHNGHNRENPAAPLEEQIAVKIRDALWSARKSGRGEPFDHQYKSTIDLITTACTEASRKIVKLLPSSDQKPEIVNGIPPERCPDCGGPTPEPHIHCLRFGCPGMARRAAERRARSTIEEGKIVALEAVGGLTMTKEDLAALPEEKTILAEVDAPLESHEKIKGLISRADEIVKTHSAPWDRNSDIIWEAYQVLRRMVHKLDPGESLRVAHLEKHYELSQSAIGILRLKLKRENPAIVAAQPWLDKLHDLHNGRLRELGAGELIRDEPDAFISTRGESA